MNTKVTYIQKKNQNTRPRLDRKIILEASHQISSRGRKPHQTTWVTSDSTWLPRLSDITQNLPEHMVGDHFKYGASQTSQAELQITQVLQIARSHEQNDLNRDVS
jgi:hypothetical protein